MQEFQSVNVADVNLIDCKHSANSSTISIYSLPFIHNVLSPKTIEGLVYLFNFDPHGLAIEASGIGRVFIALTFRSPYPLAG